MAPSHQNGAPGARLHIVKKVEDAPRTQPKVLRIGVVESGRIVDEKIIGRGGDVSVGTSEKNDFVIASDILPSRFKLFEVRGGSYSLCFTDDMEGRISFPGGFSELSVLRSSGRVKRSGRAWSLELDGDARGKVRIGDSTVLFQMVNAPTAQPRPQLPASVRGGWLRRLDWFFTSMLLVSFLAQFGLVTWMVQRDWPIQPTFDLYSDNVYVRTLFDSPPSQTQIDEMTQTPEDSADAVDAVEAPSADPESIASTPTKRPASSSTAGPSKSSALAQAEATDRVRAALDEQARAFLGRVNLIGSLNPDGDGAVADVLRGGGVEVDQDTLLAQITGVEIATAGQETVLRRPVSGSDGDGRPRQAILGSLRASGAEGSFSSGEVGPETAPQARVKRGAPVATPTSLGSLDPGAVRRVVGTNLGGIKACYERELRRSPGLAGRVAITFTIGEGGRVLRASAVQNTLGVPAVGTCIETRFRSMRFPSPDGGPVTFNHPFIFSPSH